MNEAARCDRISLMHAGRVLAQDTPAGAGARRGASRPEEAFIAYLEEAAGVAAAAPRARRASCRARPPAERRRRARPRARSTSAGCGPTRAARRMEILRDPIRLAFALLGPLLLMLVFGYGISFDVEKLPSRCSTATARRRAAPTSTTSRARATSSSRPPIAADAELDRRLPAASSSWRIEIPPDFGRDLRAAGTPEVGVWIDGAMPFRAETSRGYVRGVHQTLSRRAACATSGDRAGRRRRSRIETRFRYNPAFKSVYAIVPGVDHDRPDADPGDDDGGRRGAREGARLDHQFLRDAGDAGSSSCSASSCLTSRLAFDQLRASS